MAARRGAHYSPAVDRAGPSLGAALGLDWQDLMRRISPRVLDWAIVGCGALIFAGFALVTRAANEGQLESTLISPWHIPVYGGALLAAYLLLDSADPAPGTPWRR
jgi:lipid-A-disaccharide synthase-like uncharacterized protein